MDSHSCSFPLTAHLLERVVGEGCVLLAPPDRHGEVGLEAGLIQAGEGVPGGRRLKLGVPAVGGGWWWRTERWWTERAR